MKIRGSWKMAGHHSAALPSPSGPGSYVFSGIFGHHGTILEPLSNPKQTVDTVRRHRRRPAETAQARHEARHGLDDASTPGMRCLTSRRAWVLHAVALLGASWPARFCFGWKRGRKIMHDGNGAKTWGQTINLIGKCRPNQAKQWYLHWSTFDGRNAFFACHTK